MVGGIVPCNICAFKASSKATLIDHMKQVHDQEKRKRQKETVKCEEGECASTFDCNDKLNEHKRAQHAASSSNSSTTESKSPCSSPPRKKSEKHLDEKKEVEMLDLDNMEIKVDNELNINFILEKRINELEVLVASLLEEKKKDEEL